MKSIREIWKLLCERSEKSQQLQKIQYELDAKIPMQWMRLDKDVRERSFLTLNFRVTIQNDYLIEVD